MLKYARGTEILTSQPFVYITEKERRGRICDFCFSGSENLRRCSRCKILYFCGKKCQAAAWPDHKVECACLEKVSPVVPANPVRFFCRLLIKLKVRLAAAWPPFHCKCRHSRSYKRHVSCSTDRTGVWARAFFRRPGCTRGRDQEGRQAGGAVPEAMDDGRGVLGRQVPASCRNWPRDLRKGKLRIFSMVVNTYTITNYEECPVGTGLYIGPSILDHSCTPNAHAVFDGSTLRLRATADIECNSVDGIRVSYIDLKELRRTRIEELRERYYFSCNCPRCSADEAQEYLTEESPSLTAKAKELLGEFMRTEVHAREDLVRLRGQAEALLSSHELPATDAARSEALELLSKSCLEMGDFDAALPYYLAKEETYRRCYGPFSPVYGVLLFTIAKLYHHKALLPEALQYFEKASEVVTVSHGRNHRLYRDLSEALCHCKLELQAHSNHAK
ncbi:unnamed protein product [Ixodes persulcatus]